MALDILGRIAQLIEDQSEELLAEWRTQVRALPAAKNLDVPTLNDHIPLLLDELVTAFRIESGLVAVESELGVGSTFRITLPGRKK